MKRGLILLLLMISVVVCLGMGGLGGQPEGTIPKTDINIRAQLNDHGGISTTLTQFSMDGKTFLEARLGKGQLTIPFQEIDQVAFDKVQGERVRVDVKLKSGESMNLTISSRAQFYGATGFGAYRILARDVASIAIL